MTSPDCGNQGGEIFCALIESTRAIHRPNRDSDGRSGCGIVDVGVYTKNRNFRLFLSSKFGKAAVLKLHDSSADGAFSKMSRREVFLKSLVTSVPDDGVQTVKFGTSNPATSRPKGTIHIHMLFPLMGWAYKEGKPIGSSLRTEIEIENV